MNSKATFLAIFGDMITRINDRVSLKAVILFGSHARGTAYKFSDYDLVIIADF